MKILSIGTDRKLFEERSAVLERSKDYASLVDEMHIVVFSLKKDNLCPRVHGNLYLYPTNSSSRLGYITNAFFIGRKIIRNKLLSKKDSVISCQDPFETGFVGLILKKIYKLPIQIQIHTDFLSSNFNNNLLNKFRVFIANFIIPSADGIRVVSHGIKKSIESKFTGISNKTSILPVFVDIEKIINTVPTRNIKKDFPQFDSIIFMASRLSKEKNIPLALDAFKEVLVDFPSAGLIISGSGSEWEELERKAKNLRINNNVVFIGWQDDLVSYYKTADIFLMVSDYEGYGMALLEAAASSCPVITTKVGLAETDLFVGGENSLVCPVGDVTCIKNSILDLLKNKDKRESFKTAMLEKLKNNVLTKEQYNSTYIGLIQGLLKN